MLSVFQNNTFENLFIVLGLVTKLEGTHSLKKITQF